MQNAVFFGTGSFGGEYHVEIETLPTEYSMQHSIVITSENYMIIDIINVFLLKSFLIYNTALLKWISSSTFSSTQRYVTTSSTYMHKYMHLIHGDR